VRGINLDSAS
jgi:sensor c-di-GMP phosphodiesterase-like protein